MGRSLKKGPFVNPKLFQKVERLSNQGIKEPVKTWARACTIVPEFVGHTFLVHNGKLHLKVFVTEDMVLAWEIHPDWKTEQIVDGVKRVQDLLGKAITA